MTQQPLRFDDGEAYERGMGPWSQLVGQVFLDWVAQDPGLKWIDVGCGNGAFTELLAQRCAPAEIQAIDPSEPQIAYARARTAAQGAEFRIGDAMALPFENGRFDAAVMALVLLFVPDPAKGVAEMVRVVRPGGSVSAYVWDLFADGTPSAPAQAELLAFGIQSSQPPSAGVSRMAALRDAWTDAGLEAVETREIVVRRTFVDFDELWRSSTAFPSIAPIVAKMTAEDIERFKAGLRTRLPAAADGRISYEARANAIKGRVPKRT